MRIFAGAAEVAITPPVGLDMTGFGGRPSGNVGVHDDLYARAVVLADLEGPSRVALVSMDLCSLDFDIVESVRQRVFAQTGIEPDRLFLNATHTHHGPATINLRGLGCRDARYVSGLVEKLTEVVHEANGRLVPASLLAGRAPVQIGVNRRVRTGDGGTRFGENETAAADREVRVLRVEDAHGAPVAAVFNHAVHPICVGRTNLLISADFVGYAADQVRKALGRGGIPVFLQGCAGNINPWKGGQDTFEQAELLGRQLGDAVVTAWEKATPLRAPLTPEAARKTTRLPLCDPPPVREARAALEHARQRLDELRATCDNRGPVWVQEGNVEWAGKVLALAEEGRRPRFQDFELQALTIGDFALVGMSGEVFFEIAQQIEAASPFRHTMVLAYHNGCIGYVPTAEAFPEGGYEVIDAIRLYGTLMMRPESEAWIVREALGLLQP
ncbi:MAG: hypothetical protein EXS64_12920 [Candidatus Latescibacteria bacterium]|nr:hypothetical protein [Candidatus Latescibacterota bacterium]